MQAVGSSHNARATDNEKLFDAMQIVRSSHNARAADNGKLVEKMQTVGFSYNSHTAGNEQPASIRGTMQAGAYSHNSHVANNEQSASGVDLVQAGGYSHNNHNANNDQRASGVDMVQAGDYSYNNRDIEEMHARTAEDLKFLSHFYDFQIDDPFDQDGFLYDTGESEIDKEDLGQSIAQEAWRARRERFSKRNKLRSRLGRLSRSSSRPCTVPCAVGSVGTAPRVFP